RLDSIGSSLESIFPVSIGITSLRFGALECHRSGIQDGVISNMEMGLCLVCDEPFTVDHARKHKGIRFVVVEMDEEEVEQVNDEKAHEVAGVSQLSCIQQTAVSAVTHVSFMDSEVNVTSSVMVSNTINP
ncbi:hypothetical protein L195_g061403, partial [Trifolium pratense]